MRWVHLRRTARQPEKPNERERSDGAPASVPAGLPCFRCAPPRYIAALPLRHWRFGAGRISVDRSPPRGWAKLVAGAAAGSHRVRQLALSVPVFFRRERTGDQPGLPDRGRPVAAAATVRTARSRQPPSITTPSFRSSIGLLETAWANFRAGARPDLRPAYEQFCTAHRHWLDDYALFRALKVRHHGAYYLEWPVELVRRVPAALTRARQATGGPNRSSSGRAIPAVPPSGTPQGICPRQRLAADRRSALFRFSRLERRLGQPGTVPARRTPPAARSSPASLPTISAPRGNSGAIPSMTGTPFAGPVTAGASIVCALFSLMSMLCVWIISAHSRPPGTYQPERLRRSPASGCPVQALSSSKRPRES